MILVFIADLICSLIDPNNEDKLLTYLSLVDAIAFLALTIILISHTIVLFINLTKFESGMVADKWLIATMCSLFTVSYASRTIFLIVQGLEVIENPKLDSCRGEWLDNIFFLSLLPLFDFVPIIVIFLFHLVKFVCKTGLSPKKKKSYKSS